MGYGFEMNFEPISEKGMGFFVLEGVIDMKKLLDLQIHSGTYVCPFLRQNGGGGFQ